MGKDWKMTEIKRLSDYARQQGGPGGDPSKWGDTLGDDDWNRVAQELFPASRTGPQVRSQWMNTVRHNFYKWTKDGDNFLAETVVNNGGAPKDWNPFAARHFITFGEHAPTGDQCRVRWRLKVRDNAKTTKRKQRCDIDKGYEKETQRQWATQKQTQRDRAKASQGGTTTTAAGGGLEASFGGGVNHHPAAASNAAGGAFSTSFGGGSSNTFNGGFDNVHGNTASTAAGGGSGRFHNANGNKTSTATGGGLGTSFGGGVSKVNGNTTSTAAGEGTGTVFGDANTSTTASGGGIDKMSVEEDDDFFLDEEDEFHEQGAFGDSTDDDSEEEGTDDLMPLLVQQLNLEEKALEHMIKTHENQRKTHAEQNANQKELHTKQNADQKELHTKQNEQIDKQNDQIDEQRKSLAANSNFMKQLARKRKTARKKRVSRHN